MVGVNLSTSAVCTLYYNVVGGNYNLSSSNCWCMYCTISSGWKFGCLYYNMVGGNLSSGNIAYHNVYHYTIGTGKHHMYRVSSQEQNLSSFIVSLCFASPTSTYTNVHTCTYLWLALWLGLMTPEVKGLLKKSS